MTTTRDRHHRHIWRPFTQAATAPPPLVAVSGRGARITAEDGRDYLDMISSWWVNLHGHAHAAIAKAIADQAGRLEQVIFAEFTHAPATTLAERVCALLPGDLERVFYTDDGSTAVEAALKIAVQYWSNLGQPRRSRFIAFAGGYHGDTVGAMSAGAGSGFFRAWDGLLFPVDLAPFPATWDGDDQVAAKEDAALAEVARLLAPGDVAAVVVEPLVQGAAGMRMCRPAFLARLAALVGDAGALLVLDEVMTGFGRTGPLFACHAAGVVPDLICLSKGLTGGFMPLAMTVARAQVYQAFLGEDLDRAFLHGHSFTANPLGCAAALASLDLLLSAECGQRRQAISISHRQALDRLAEHPRACRTRLTGTVAAFDLAGAEGGYGAGIGLAVKRACLERGVLVRPLGPVVYLLPPYCTEEAELDQAWQAVERALDLL